MVKIKLHGDLGDQINKEYLLKVYSVSEAIHAIDTLTHSKLRQYLFDQKNRFKKYTLLVNGKVNKAPALKDIKGSEACMNHKNLKTIDIIPVLEGSGKWLENDWFAIGLGVLGLAFGGSNPFTLAASMALIFAGVSNLLSDPPEAPPQQDIVNPSSDPARLATSYLFGGPVNVLNEGGAVPLGYGRLLVGSQVIMSSYEVRGILTRDAGRVA